MSRLYQYVGAAELNNQAALNTVRAHITAETDALEILGLTVTFIVDAAGLLAAVRSLSLGPRLQQRWTSLVSSILTVTRSLFCFVAAKAADKPTL